MFLLLCTLVFAEEQVITLEEGEKAPFSGTLLSPNAAARLLADGETDLQTCLANSEYDKKILESEWKYKVRLSENNLAVCSMKLEDKEKLYGDHIKYLEAKAVTPEWHKPAYFAGGVVTGIGVMLGSAWILNQIGANNVSQ
jgi:hypothetical protein